MAASSHFLSLTPQTLTRPGSAASAAIASSTFFTPCSLKPLPKLALALSSVKNYTHYPTSRFVRRVSVSSDLEEDLEGGDGEEEVNGGFPGAESEVPSYSPDLKLFVGNLPYNVDSAALAELFGQAGGVEMVEVIYDKSTGRSRGFGFVTMSSVEEVEAAAQQFNGYELEGRALRVNSGPPPPKREFSSFRGSRGRERSGSNDTNMLFVGNLAWEVDNNALGTLFSECGEVSEARVVYDRDSGRSRGFGFVTYSSPEEASNAVERLDGTDLDGRPIRVSPAESRY